MTIHSCPALRTGAALCLVVCAAMHLAPGAACAEPRSLLRSSVPGAFGVRYLPDRAVLTFTVAAPETQGAPEALLVALYLPQPVRWGYLDRQPLASRQLKWNAEAEQVELTLPFGSHRLHLGWAGSGKLPPESASIPVRVGDQAVGVLRARFDLGAMEASGSLDVGPAEASVRLKLAADVDPEVVSLTCGQESVRRWSKGETVLVGMGSMLVPESTRITLRVAQYGLDASPIQEVQFERVRPPSRAVRVRGDIIPEDAVLVEAEDFVASGGAPVTVEPGSHYDQHGGASVFSFQGDGAWLEWVFDAPADGLYDLYARVACADEVSFRRVEVNGASPPGLALVQFPGTGGWAHAPGEWWLMQIAGTGEQAPPLKLNAGEVRIRFTGVLEHHLNVDYVLMAPHH